MTIPSFNVSLEDDNVIQAIVTRAFEATGIGIPRFNKLRLTMDLKACHANGCQLDLDALLVAGKFDFYHDLLGIERYLDRKTGQLQEHFFPRHSK